MFDKARTKGHVQLLMKRRKLTLIFDFFFNIDIERLSFLYLFTFLIRIDDGKTKPDQKPETVKPNKKTHHATKVAANKSRSESTSSHHGEPEYMCLIRATFKKEKISTVVSLFLNVKKFKNLKIKQIFIHGLRFALHGGLKMEKCCNKYVEVVCTMTSKDKIERFLKKNFLHSKGPLR